MLTDELATSAALPPVEPPPPRHEEAPPELQADEATATEDHAAAPSDEQPAAAEGLAASAPPPAAEEKPAEEPAATEEPAPVPPPVEAEPAEQAPNNKHWYVVKVQSGREETIKEAIERKVKIEGLEEFYGQIYVPVEKVTEMRRGKRYTRERKILPGYLMAEVEYNDRILYLFRETSGVGDFVGGTVNRPPTPMSQREIDRWMRPVGVPDEKGTPITHDFEKNDRVRVKDGMFAGMEGEVKDIVEAKNSVKVELTIFGRPVPVELEYWQVEHV